MAGKRIKGDVFDSLGFSHSEASELKMRADLLDAILERVKTKNYTQSQLVQLLDEYQPAVSNLLHGKIDKVSLEKLVRYADRLGMRTTIHTEVEAQELTCV
jgi:predicted XRE-type DNA-binding protein